MLPREAKKAFNWTDLHGSKVLWTILWVEYFAMYEFQNLPLCNLKPNKLFVCKTYSIALFIIFDMPEQIQSLCECVVFPVVQSHICLYWELLQEILRGDSWRTYPRPSQANHSAWRHDRQTAQWHLSAEGGTQVFGRTGDARIVVIDSGISLVACGIEKCNVT